MDDPSTSSAENLEQVDDAQPSLKRLARRILRDDAAADDVVQEVWLAALENPPSGLENPGGWLRSVARNISLARRRALRNRRDRERSVARAERILGPDAIVEREAVRRSLHEAVAELGSPYDAVVRLRFLEGLSVHEVAQRRGVPSGTIKSQTARGLERLRQRLQEEYGDGRCLGLELVFAFDWDAEDLPAELVQRAGGAEARWSARIALPVLGLVIAAGWWAWPEPPAPDGEVAALPDRQQTRRVLDDAPVSGARQAIVVPSPASEPRQPGAPLSQSVLVVDPAGMPVAGAMLLCRTVFTGNSLERVGVTDEQGHAQIVLDDAHRFRISDANPRVATSIQAKATGLVDSVVEYVTEPREEPLVLRVGGPELAIRGRVLDAWGAPLEGFLVHVGEDTGVIHPHGDGTWWATRRHRAVSTADGSFRLAGLSPGVVEITARKDGAGIQTMRVDGSAPGEIVSDLVVPAGAILRGRVVDSGGRPVAGMLVRQDAIVFHDPRAYTDAQGCFELRGLPPRPNRFTTYGPGGTWDDLVWTPEPGEEREHEFQLRSGRNVIVRVVDETGAPFAGAVVVFTSAPSAIPYARQMSTTSEGVAHLVGIPSERIIAVVLTRDKTTHIARLEWTAPDGVEETVVYRRDQVPLAGVRGVCLQSDGTLWRSATVRFTNLDVGSRTELPLDEETGEFERQLDTGPYLLELIVEDGGATRLGEFDLFEGEVNELGVLRTRPPGRLETEFLFDGDPGSYRYRVRSRMNAGDHVGIVSGTGAPPAELDVLPGVVRVWVHAGDEELADRSGRVGPGGTLRLRLGPDLPVDLNLVFDRPSACPDETARLIVTRYEDGVRSLPRPDAPLEDHLDALVDNQGVEVANVNVACAADGRFSHRLEVSPGSVYNAFLESPDGWVGSVWFPLEGWEFEVGAVMRRP